MFSIYFVNQGQCFEIAKWPPRKSQMFILLFGHNRHAPYWSPLSGFIPLLLLSMPAAGCSARVGLGAPGTSLWWDRSSRHHYMSAPSARSILGWSKLLACKHPILLLTNLFMLISLILTMKPKSIYINQWHIRVNVSMETKWKALERWDIDDLLLFGFSVLPTGEIRASVETQL